MNFLKIVPSWILKMLGVGTFIDKVLHVPDDALSTVSGLAGITPSQWRRVEAIQKQIVKDGIAIRVPGAEV